MYFSAMYYVDKLDIVRRFSARRHQTRVGWENKLFWS